MANIYVRNAGSGTSPFDTWAKAATTLAAALAVATASDTVWVADDHSESTVGSVAWALASTTGLRILCANTHVTEPPTGLAATAVIATTSTSASSIAGQGYIHGITFSIGSSTNNGTLSLGGSADNVLVFSSCTFILGGNNTSSRINIGPAGSGSNKASIVKWLNCSAKFANATQSFSLQHGFLHFINLSVDGTGAHPVTLFRITANGLFPVALIECSDLSGVTPTNLIDVSTDVSADITFRNCKFSVATVTGAIPAYGATRLHIHNCDTGATNYNLYEGSFAGTVEEETTIVRSGGASDGTTALSWKMGTNANAIYPQAPLRSPEIVVWNDTTGSSKAATVEFVHDTNVSAGQGAGASSAFQNNEVWLELLYISASGTPLGSFISSAPADVMTSASDDASSSATWTTTGLTTPVTQKLSVTFTPQMKGYIHARVCVGKASKTVYVDPVLTVA